MKTLWVTPAMNQWKDELLKMMSAFMTLIVFFTSSANFFFEIYKLENT